MCRQEFLKTSAISDACTCAFFNRKSFSHYLIQSGAALFGFTSQSEAFFFSYGVHSGICSGPYNGNSESIVQSHIPPQHS
jgi:hypothetical protein